MDAHRAVRTGLEDVRRAGRVERVADDGTVVLLLPDGQERTVTIPREAVSLVRRLAEIGRARTRNPEEA